MLLLLISSFAMLSSASILTSVNTASAQANSTEQQSSLASNASDKSGTVRSDQRMYRANGILIQMCSKCIQYFFFNYIYLQCHIRNVPVPFFLDLVLINSC